MSRNGSGVYSLPAGSTVTNGDTSDATDINTPLQDLETDMNTPRPVVAGGTGATSASGARTNLGLGTLATQANTAVDIDGGSIDGTPIGAATPAAGNFTDTTIAGQLSATGLGGFWYAAKTANTTRATTETLADDDHLTVTLPTGRFMFEANILTTAGAGALEFGWTVPASTTMEWGIPASPGPTALGENDTLVVSDTASALKLTCVRGIVRILTPGTFALRWAQDTSNAADSTVVINSMIKLEKLGN